MRMPTREHGRRRTGKDDHLSDPRLVAAIAAVLAAVEGEPVRLRVRAVWPVAGAWRTMGRQDSMRGGWPW